MTWVPPRLQYSYPINILDGKLPAERLAEHRARHMELDITNPALVSRSLCNDATKEAIITAFG